MSEQTQWYPLLPGDGWIEFPTMGDITLVIASRHDGNYECDVKRGDSFLTTMMLTPDANIAICIRKTPEQASKDESAFIDKFNAIFGLEVLTKKQDEIP